MVQGSLLLFARHPTAGDAKTRLAATRRADGTPIGSQGAQLLHRAFLMDALAGCRASGAQVALAHTPGPSFEEALVADLVFEQSGDNFGERLDDALARTHRWRPNAPLAVIGSDTPHLDPSALGAALEKLDTCDAVLGPSTKGGFYLLGFRCAPLSIRSVFSAPDECAAVADTITSAGLKLERLPPYWDIDEPQDVEALLHLAARAAGGSSSPERRWVPQQSFNALRLLGLSDAQAPNPATTAEARRPQSRTTKP